MQGRPPAPSSWSQVSSVTCSFFNGRLGLSQGLVRSHGLLLQTTIKVTSPSKGSKGFSTLSALSESFLVNMSHRVLLDRTIVAILSIKNLTTQSIKDATELLGVARLQNNVAWPCFIYFLRRARHGMWLPEH